MKILEPIAHTVIAVLFIAVTVIVLTACETEDLECPVEDRYVVEYQPVKFPSGDVILQPIWECP